MAASLAFCNHRIYDDTSKPIRIAEGSMKGLSIKQECLEANVLEYSRSICFAEAVGNHNSQTHHKVWAKINIMRTCV